jgi:hypothetical protein
MAKGNVGGCLIRRAYQRALAVPGPGLERLWRRYEQFEQGASKSGPLGRRILDEQRPRYQAAREAARERSVLLGRVDARALALPPGARIAWNPPLCQPDTPQ